MQHYRKTKMTYERHLKSDRKVTKVCSFCTSTKSEPILAQNDSMYVVSNRVSYDMFEGRRVLEHLMIIPKEHRASVADFTSEEAQDYIAFVGAYELQGYNIYARGFDSPSRSVAHQHTHLIKLASKAPKVVIYSAKPYVLLDL